MKSINNIRSKILDCEKLAEKLKKDRKAGRKIVFTNGCFDILHRGHIEYLSSAADLGDVFIIGLNSDDSVRKIKGENRPAVDEDSRALILASFEFVDYLVLFSEDTPSEVMLALRPDVWVKGGDYKVEEIVGYEEVISYGGVVETIPFLEGYSSTELINRIK